MVERDGVAGFAREIVTAACVAGVTGLVVAGSSGPLSQIVAAQSEPWVALVAIAAVSALSGASVAVVSSACAGPRD